MDVLGSFLLEWLVNSSWQMPIGALSLRKLCLHRDLPLNVYMEIKTIISSVMFYVHTYCGSIGLKEIIKREGL